MSPFDKLLRRNSRQVETPVPPPPGDIKGEEYQPTPEDSTPPADPLSTQAAPPGLAPGTAPPPQQPWNPARGPGPSPQTQVLGQNVGMLAGGALGRIDGAGIGGGMVEGEVVGGMIGQRVGQYQKHMYWRDRSMEYRAALAAGAPPLSAQAEGEDGKKASWWSREGREQRRLKRWERRAERRDGVNLGGQ